MLFTLRTRHGVRERTIPAEIAEYCRLGFFKRVLVACRDQRDVEDAVKSIAQWVPGSRVGWTYQLGYTTMYFIHPDVSEEDLHRKFHGLRVEVVLATQQFLDHRRPVKHIDEAIVDALERAIGAPK